MFLLSDKVEGGVEQLLHVPGLGGDEGDGREDSGASPGGRGVGSVGRVHRLHRSGGRDARLQGECEWPGGW